MNTFTKLILIFLALTGAASILINQFDVTYGVDNFWDKHGIFFLFFITAFPRLTLLFSSIPFGGLFWWAGLIFAPRILVAILATIAYWEQNPILVIISWTIALGGESTEKYVVTQKSREFRKDEVFEAEFRVKDSN